MTVNMFSRFGFASSTNHPAQVDVLPPAPHDRQPQHGAGHLHYAHNVVATTAVVHTGKHAEVKLQFPLRTSPPQDVPPRPSLGSRDDDRILSCKFCERTLRSVRTICGHCQYVHTGDGRHVRVKLCDATSSLGGLAHFGSQQSRLSHQQLHRPLASYHNSQLPQEHRVQPVRDTSDDQELQFEME
ncbi:hypothetical protein CAOG_02650 [Capsaspora owczarzaki ATCC 30864]|uniref:C2H2-type domain-containing protein n=1 Tax=Capsaspora owczarzaki (strain ATCC 30864) TaxID=595528 RepID=A0A0D2VMU9_CAPO3|nr:hypothetical protein CAOG_02650 [Capsaspora owczarzaki ATCC 30864]KJE91522.1 hypothetical protein CAOG_002650 [Capsaspora owczarzaki ATCC 30864]|eukprot:XP_004349400.1 hypothetical protein CAOG_02650 [Capsaspora owczarzaki ATCC 30864]